MPSRKPVAMLMVGPDGKFMRSVTYGAEGNKATWVKDPMKAIVFEYDAKLAGELSRDLGVEVLCFKLS